MNKLKAAALISEHRRRWHSQDSDYAIARRGERAYLALAIMQIGLTPAFVPMLIKCSLLFRIALPVMFLIAASFYYWQSRRFTWIRRCLSEQDPNLVSL